MKKSISILVLLALVAGGAFALDMAVGGGLLFDYSGNNGIEYMSAYEGLRATSFEAFGFLLGAGLGFSFTEAVFLRAEAMFNLRLASKWQDDLVK
jgi:hypothetical protein